MYGAPDVARVPEEVELIRCSSTRHEVPLKSLDRAALLQLEQYDRPGNVRELRNMMESQILTVPGDLIGVHGLPAETETGAGGAFAAARTRPALAPPRDGLNRREKSELEQICLALQETAGNATLAANRLGMAKSTLYLKVKKYGLEDSLGSLRAPGASAL